MNTRMQAKLFCVPCILLATLLAVMLYLVNVRGLFVDSIWFDKVMHTMGGWGSCLLACWIIVNLPSRWRVMILGVSVPMIGRMAGLFFGIDWEIAEAVFPVITNYIPQGIWDTAFDLAFDYVGGYIAGIVIQREVGFGRLFLLPCPTCSCMVYPYLPPSAKRGASCVVWKTQFTLKALARTI